jgi:hypothetical protein
LIWALRLSISSALLCSDAGWLRELVTKLDLLFLRMCGETGRFLEDNGFKGGCQNWTRLKSTVAIIEELKVGKGNISKMLIS